MIDGAATNVLPPQLALKLGDAVVNVAEMCEFAPGVGWSKQLLEDMLEDLQRLSITQTHIFGGLEVWVELTHSPRTPDFRPPATHDEWQQTLDAYSKKPKSIHVAVCAIVADKDCETILQRHHCFPASRVGLKAALSWMLHEFAVIERRGPCEHCLKENRVQLAVSGTKQCSECLVGSAMLGRSEGSEQEEAALGAPSNGFSGVS